MRHATHRHSAARPGAVLAVALVAATACGDEDDDASDATTAVREDLGIDDVFDFDRYDGVVVVGN